MIGKYHFDDYLCQVNYIRDLVVRRNIQKLIHFTDAKNIKSISKYGILSVAELQRRKWHYSINDTMRLDGLLDYISLSITNVNHYLFNRFLQKGSLQMPFIIEISPRILWETSNKKIYCSTNAATKHSYKGSDLQNFENLFANTIKYVVNGEAREIVRYKQKDNEPTDPQAEILYQRNIEPRYFMDIYRYN